MTGEFSDLKLVSPSRARINFTWKKKKLQKSYIFERGLLYVLSHVRHFMTPWTVARWAPPSMGFPRQEYWSGLPFPAPGDLPDPGIKPTSLVSSTLAGKFFTTASWEAPYSS